MAKCKVRIDELKLAEIARQGMQRALEGDGLEGACPFCGERLMMHLPETHCPHCGKSFVPKVG